MPILADFWDLVNFMVSNWGFCEKSIFNFDGLYLWAPLAYRNDSVLSRILLASAFICHPDWADQLRLKGAMANFRVSRQNRTIPTLSACSKKHPPRDFFDFFGLIPSKYDNLDNKKNLEIYFSIFLRNWQNSEIFTIFDLPMFSDHLTTNVGPHGSVTMIMSKPIKFRPIRNLTDPKKVEK